MTGAVTPLAPTTLIFGYDNSGSANLSVPYNIIAANGVGIADNSINAPAPSISAEGGIDERIAPVPDVIADGLTGEVGSAVIGGYKIAPWTFSVGFGGSVGSVDIDAPSPSVLGDFGGHGAVKHGASVAASGFTGIVGTGSIRVPTAVAVGEGIAESLATVTLTPPAAAITALGVTDELGTVSITVPLSELEASGFSGSVGIADVVAPAAITNGFLAVAGFGTASIIVPAAEIQAFLQNAPFVNTLGIVMNTTNAAVTEYTGLQVNAVAEAYGLLMIATPDGILYFDSNSVTDGAVPFEFVASSTKKDLRNTSSKNIHSGFVGGEMSGKCLFKLAMGDKSHFYNLIPRESGKGSARIKFGRGVRHRSFGWGIKGSGVSVRVTDVFLDVERLNRRVW